MHTSLLTAALDRLRCHALFLLLILFGVALSASAHSVETIAAAHYAAPTERYGHFALGRPHEYAQLRATTSTGRALAFELPDDEVFEDLVPRIIKLAPSDPSEILAIVSRRGVGARLVLFGLEDSAIVIKAQSAPIGISHRWLNPVGVADLDGDGRAEIAAVITPHLAGPLKVYGRRGRELVELSALAGFSNHVYGSAELGLSTPAASGAGMRLLVPDASRRFLRIIAFEGGRLVEVGRCALASPVVGAVLASSLREVSVVLATGRTTLGLAGCEK